MTDSMTKPTPKRRFRFSLRTLLLVLTLLCLWLGWKTKQAREQRDAVAAIRAVGGMVFYAYQFEGARPLAEAEPPVPEWLSSLIGEDYFLTVVNVQLRAPHVPGEVSFHPESSQSSVTSPITDSTLERLASLRDLTAVGVDLRGSVPHPEGSNVSDAGIAQLARLPRLRRLWIYAPNISDEALRSLTPLKRLEELRIWGGHLTDDGLIHLQDLPALRSLWLEGGLVYQMLVDGTQIDRTETRFAQAGLRHIGELTHLEEVELYGFEVEDEGLAALENLTDTISITLKAMEVPESQITSLRDALPQTQIIVSRSNPTMRTINAP